MMPDLGRYATEVLSAYAVSLLLLAGLVALSWWQGARTRRALRDTETRSAARSPVRPPGEGRANG